MEKIEVKWNIIFTENLQSMDAFTFQYTPPPPKTIWCVFVVLMFYLS